MKKNLISFVIAVLLITTSLFAQVDVAKINDLKKAALLEMSTAKEDAHKDYYQKIHSRAEDDPERIDLHLESFPKGNRHRCRP